MRRGDGGNEGGKAEDKRLARVGLGGQSGKGSARNGLRPATELSGLLKELDSGSEDRNYTANSYVSTQPFEVNE